MLAQDGEPLGFYTRKLNAAQSNYTVREKELLQIVEDMKAFEVIIRGYDITIHANYLSMI